MPTTTSSAPPAAPASWSGALATLIDGLLGVWPEQAGHDLLMLPKHVRPIREFLAPLLLPGVDLREESAAEPSKWTSPAARPSILFY